MQNVELLQLSKLPDGVQAIGADAKIGKVVCQDVLSECGAYSRDLMFLHLFINAKEVDFAVL